MSKLRRKGDLLVNANKSPQTKDINKVKLNRKVEKPLELKNNTTPKSKTKPKQTIKKKTPSVGKNKNEATVKKPKKEDLGFRVIRKEIVGFAPLQYLDLFNKFKVAFSYRAKKSGKTDKKLEEKKRQRESSLMALQSSIIMKIKDETKELIEGDKIEKEIELSSGSPLFREALDLVLRSEYMKLFQKVQEVPHNKNYLKYTKRMPVVIKVVK